MTPGWQTATCCTTEFGERRERWCWAEEDRSRSRAERGWLLWPSGADTSRAKAASAAVMASNGGLTARG
ncbi:hypothetical protein CASFOL_008918 [Castilleja foliolosa]|uniref:Uncharacterized protein n=1 Tax=Castilleja foliolosa TaxID=1961234 RepID=A0ABD3E4E2_9LAMI